MRLLSPAPLALVAALSSCATERIAQRLTHPTENRSAGVKHLTEQFQSADQTLLHQESWTAESGQSRGVLAIVHGLKDYGARYADFARHLVTHGFAVYAFDLRGHGHSGGARARIEHFDEYLDDLGQFITRVKQREGTNPVFVFGHSMGGAISTLYTERNPDQVSGLILSAAALAANASGFTRALTSIVGTLFPGLGVLELPDAQFSRNSHIVESMTMIH